jgi:hypothetical protein
MNLRNFTLCLLLGTVCALAGCGPSGPKKYRVVGDVTWEGSALPDGDIVFTPTGGGVPDAGKITGGKYDVQVTEGAKQVSIFAMREEGPVDPAMGVARRRNFIPERYNDKTILTANVTPDGPNQFDFPLTEKELPK